MTYISRAITPRIEEAHKYYPVITITGPRQSGKSTLCKHMYPDYRYVTLESIATRSLAATDPRGFLENLGDNVIIDEVQHVPELLSEIQVRVDEDRNRRYILTGSSNFSLLKNVTQSLAGRTALFTLLPFSFKEMTEGMKNLKIEEIIIKGFYPGVLVDNIPPKIFYENYYNTYVERDLRDLLKVSNLLKFDAFVRLLALRVGSEFNASALSREIGVSSVTVSEWLSLLVSSYIIFELPPYFRNQGKSLTKNKKVYFYDTGLLSHLLMIKDEMTIENNLQKGALFENLAISEFMKKSLIEDNNPNLYFYRENRGIEVDLLVPTSSDGFHLYEVKAGKTLQSDYAANMKKLSSQIEVNISTTVIYNGESYPPLAINVRDI